MGIMFISVVLFGSNPPPPTRQLAYTGNTKRRNTQCEVRRSLDQIRQQLKKLGLYQYYVPSMVR